MNQVVGVTGCMGSGKTRAALFLQKISGVKYIDTDLICRILLKPEAAGWNAIVQSFGRQYLSEDGTINRSLLRQAIFNDNSVRLRLNDIIHPLARASVKEVIQDSCGGLSVKFFLVEVPLLFEAHWEDDFDSIVVIYCSKKQCILRLKKRDGLNYGEAEKALATQLPLAEKILRANHVIENSGCWVDTCLQLQHLCNLLWG